MIDVILLSHGSPDPRAQDAAIELARSVEANLVSGRVHCAFLQHGRSLTEVCDSLATHGIGRVVVVPAFVTPAFHVRIDVPAAVAAAHESSGIRIDVTDPIGADAALITALDDLLPPGPVVLAVAGTRDEHAQQSLDDVAVAWSSRRGHAVTVAHASQGSPTVAAALESSADATVAAFVLFPGKLPDRISAAAAGRFITPPLSQLPATTEAVVRRIRQEIEDSAA
jgi:sirohydrochlorin ferrochelatase